MSQKLSAEQEFVKESLFSKLPVLPKERLLGFFDNFSLATAANICTWLFVTGAWVGMMVPVPIAILLSLGAVAIPMIWICVVSILASRYGIDQGVHAKATWGTLGAIILICCLIPVFWGWASIPTTFFGRISETMFDYFGAGGTWYSSFYLWAFVCLVIGVYLTFGGPTWQKRAFNIAVPAMILLIIIITIRMVLQYGLGEIMAAKPQMFIDDPFTSVMLAFELNIGIGVSWLLNQSQWARSCKTERVAFWPNFISWGVLWGIFSIPGILVGALAGMGDPVDGLMAVGGTWVVLYFILLLLANPSSLVLELYFISLSLRNMFNKLTWKWAIFVSIPPVLLLTYLPGAYDAYSKFVTFISGVFMPIAAVWVLDLFLRRLRVSMPDLYKPSKNSTYYYWGGINWCAFAAAIIGIVVSFVIYNPLTMVINVPAIFLILGAGIPSAIVAGIIYYILYKFVLLPRKKGFLTT